MINLFVIDTRDKVRVLQYPKASILIIHNDNNTDNDIAFRPPLLSQQIQ